MTTFIRTTTPARTALRPANLIQSTSYLPFSTSSRSQESSSEPTSEPPSSTEDAPVLAEPISFSSKKEDKTFKSWLQGDGARFRKPIKGRPNWIGDTPFPLNPSFRPLPPLSDVVKTKIYNAYISNILSSDSASNKDSVVIRAISSKFGIAIDRVRAVIRLKELEKSWRDSGKTIQSLLLEGMESSLGVKQPLNNGTWKGNEPSEPSENGTPGARTVFEMVDIEGNDAPVLLPLLRHARPTTSSSSSSRSTSTPSSSSSTTKHPSSRLGRAGLTVVDLKGSKSEKGRELVESRGEGTKRGKKRE